MADYLGGGGGLDEQGENIDYIGRQVATAFKQSALPTSGATGKAAGPAGVSGTGTIAGVAPSPGASSGAAPQGAQGMTTLQQILRALGVTQSGLKTSETIKKLSAGEPLSVPMPETIEQAPAGSRGTIPTADPDFVIPQQSENVAAAELAATAEGGATGAEGDLSGLLGGAAQALPYVGGAYQVARDVTADPAKGEEAKQLQGAQGAIDLAALAAVPASGGLSLAAAPLAKRDTARAQRDPAGMTYKGAVPGLLPIADVVEMFGGPDLISKAFGAEPRAAVYDLKRHAAEHQGAQEIAALQEGYSGIPAGALDTTYAALQTPLDARGAVRSYFQAPEGMEGFTPGVHEWSSMSPEQFGSVMQWLGQDPSRLSAISGSGDIGYLDPSGANQFGGQAADSARALIARQLGLPYMSPRPAFDPGLQSSADAPGWWNQDVAQRQGVVNAEQQAYQSDLARWQASRREDPSQPMTPESAVARALPADDFGPAAALVTGSGLRDRELLEGA